LDPPKESSKEAIAKLLDYGVDVKVLTGDNDAVFPLHLFQVGIEAKQIVLGSDLEKMSEVRLSAATNQFNIFAN